MRFDLHCHTSASDGKLCPDKVLGLAEDAGLELFSVTDHDTLDGYLAIKDIPSSLRLISGVEISTVWQGMNIHIVGLDFDPDSAQLNKLLSRLSDVRLHRAQTISERLAKHGMTGGFEAANKIAKGSTIGRPHFAQFLVEAGYVDSMDEAFNKWLGAGKIGDVKIGLPEISEAVSAIVSGGGIAVLAHPLKYKMTFSKLKRLIAHFKEVGGCAVEVNKNQVDPDKTKQLIKLLVQLNLAASAGSDFHDPDWPWNKISDQSPLPHELKPVWRLF